MSNENSIGTLALACLLSFALIGCYHPPYNNFQTYHRPQKNALAGAAIGTAALAITNGPVLVGTAIGAAVGAGYGLYKDTKPQLMNELLRRQIQPVEYGDRMTLIVPTDRYYVFNTPRLNELCYPGLDTLLRFIQSYPAGPVYVAGFTDNIGTTHRKKMLSQSQAEAMVTYLWANGISAHLLSAEGYGDKNSISDNKLIHGSAQNRRIEIQWFKVPPPNITSA